MKLASLTSSRSTILFAFGLLLADIALAYDIDINLGFGDNYVNGQCVLLIQWNEPWAAVSGDCATYRNKNNVETKIAERIISGESLGYPRPQKSTPYYFTWNTLKTEVPDVDAVYCNEFGNDMGAGGNFVTLGHHSTPENNVSILTEPVCYSPLPQVTIYTQLNCMGVGQQVFGLAAVILGIHKSYRWLTGNPMCWEVAVEGSH
jgi:hypothetical protein